MRIIVFICNKSSVYYAFQHSLDFSADVTHDSCLRRSSKTVYKNIKLIACITESGHWRTVPYQLKHKTNKKKKKQQNYDRAAVVASAYSDQDQQRKQDLEMFLCAAWFRPSFFA